ncbi:MAG: diguanylate cyclase domain-containing protein [Lachnospirales bacterium]
MFEFYTILIIIGAIALIAMAVIVYNDEVLPKINKNGFFIAFTVLLFASIMEWLVVYFEVMKLPYVKVNTVLMALVFFITPCVPVLQAWAVDDRKNKSFQNFVYVVVFINFILPFLSIFNGMVFYYDSDNIYHRGDFFTIYAFMMVISIGLMFVTTYRLSKRYHNKNNFILFLIAIFLFIGVLIHFATNYDVLWIVAVISFSMLYIMYTALVNQRDVLTGLLSRRCYENQLYALKSDVKILFLDVNKFKEVNDNYGHAFGDLCLSEIGETLLKVYGKYGICYRIGGDEFCVILTKNFENVEKLNNNFYNTLLQYRLEYPMPTVSIGYSHFYIEKSNIQKVIEEADLMMYDVKKELLSKY